MKKYIFCLVLLVAQLSISQELNPLKNKDVGVVNIGIDFSKTSFIGQSGFTNPQDVYSKYLNGWNSKLIRESDVFDFQSAFKITRYKFDIEPMSEYNSKHVDPATMVKEYIPNKLTKEDLSKMVKAYTDVDDEFPVAMVWIPEYYSKKEEKALVHLVFFEVASREIILTKEMTGKAGGFGLQNFWLTPYKQFVKKIQMKYRKWSKE
jgi:hypothetical protein